MDTISEQLASAKEGDWAVGVKDGRRFEGSLYLDGDGDFRVDFGAGDSVILQYGGRPSLSVTELSVRSLGADEFVPRAPARFRVKHPGADPLAKETLDYRFASLEAVALSAREFARNPTAPGFMQLKADLAENDEAQGW